MGKIYSEHSVLLKDANHRILSREEFASFAEAKPAFEVKKEQVPSGLYLTLQHMARLIESHDPWGVCEAEK